MVQIISREQRPGDASRAATVHIAPSQTGVVVSIAEQPWLGVAAGLARSGLRTLLNPWNLIGELDDIARYVRRLQLRGEIWKAIEVYCRNVGAGTGVGPAAGSLACPYCGTLNEIGMPNCRACRAPLAEMQPVVCQRCGFLNEPEAQSCVNCREAL